MATSVTVTTGARLHFGPLAAAGSTGGKFGGVGMMVSSPRYVLNARFSDTEQCHGLDEAAARRGVEFARRVREAAGLGASLRPIQMEIVESIPSHAGLGSGTQLGLAIACAYSELAGESGLSVEVLASRSGRGLRSAIGLNGFAKGGFMVDGGRSGPRQIGTLVSRMDFPERWRLILVAPPRATGLSGDDEQSAFALQPAMPKSLTAELCRIALMEWLPALIEADFARASQAMFEFGLGVGRFFEPVQGGVFAHPQMANLADEVRQRGFTGVAQTSWGPTTAVLCEDDVTARELMNDLAGDRRWSECEFRLTEPLNRGAEVLVSWWEEPGR